MHILIIKEKGKKKKTKTKMKVVEIKYKDFVFNYKNGRFMNP
jgi:hypothetical protein